MKRNLPMNFLKMQSSLVFNLIILNCIPRFHLGYRFIKSVGFRFGTQKMNISCKLSQIVSRLKMAKADGSYIREIAKIERQDLLILDRIVHDDHRIELFGESLSKSLKNKITEDVETI